MATTGVHIFVKTICEILWRSAQQAAMRSAPFGPSALRLIRIPALRRKLRRAARSPRELVTEHRQAADGCFLCHLVLDDVPMLGQLAVLEAHDLHHDPVCRLA